MDDPVVAAMDVVRVVAFVLGAYLLVALALGLLARITRRRVVARVALAVSVPAVRRVVALVIGGGLLVGPAMVAAETRGEVPVEAPVLRRLPNESFSEGKAPPEAVKDAENAGVVVAPGDHLWAIAERTLAERWGRQPTDAEIVPFWQQLIEVNRDRLVHRDDPDLILPGQELVLPS